MEKIHSELIISPKFTESDIETLKHYFEFNKRYYSKINEELTENLRKDPLWGPLLSAQTPEQQKAQNERSLEMQRAAIYEGKWAEYTQDLVTQGVVYARMNVAYSDWYGIIKMYKDYLIQHLKKELSLSIEELLTFLDGLNKFVDYAMYGIAEAYFQEKNNIIRANEERFRAIFENSADYIFLIDENGTISMINHTGTDNRKEDIIGKSIFDFQFEGNVAEVKKAVQTVFENKTPSVYEAAYDAAGKISYFSSSVGPVFNDDGTVKAAVVITRDISEQKRAEAEIRELNTNLEKIVDKRTEELKSTNDELESFCYSISHDLRSPLRAIDGFTQILVDDYAHLMNEDAKDAMMEITSNAKRMGQLIDDLLEFSRLGKQGVTKSNLNMNELVESVLNELRSHHNNYAAKFNIHALEMARGDRGMLKQVMTNMISNALKYSAKKKEPVIEIGSYKENGDHIYYVKDNGAGFDMAYYNKLFGVFQRLHSSSEFDGTGVGLAIVHRIVTKHGGKIWAEGKVNEGATFYMSLPYSN